MSSPIPDWWPFYLLLQTHGSGQAGTLHPYETFNSWKNCGTKIMKNENSMHEVVYSPTTHEHFWGGKNHARGEIFIFYAWKYHFHAWKNHFHAWNSICKISMHENEFSSMILSCHDFFMHKTFCTGALGKVKSLITNANELYKRIIWYWPHQKIQKITALYMGLSSWCSECFMF